MKGQATIEFLGSTMLFIIVLTVTLTAMSDEIPSFQNDVQQSTKNTEIYTITEKILSAPGYHTNGSGGTDWENHVQYTEEFGLAEEYFILQKDKIDAISTTGQDKFNYTQFRNLNKLSNQYRFNFIWLPIVETSKSFTRTEPPTFIEEPNTTLYQNAENRVHYGTLKLEGQNYQFIVTAHNGIYNTTRISKDWNFTNQPPKGIGDTLTLTGGKEFTVRTFQNRERKPGTSLILRHDLKTFGANPEDVDTSITKFNRYAVLKAENTDKQPVRIEALAW